MNGKRIVVVALLAITALIVRMRGDGSPIVPSVPLNLLPSAVGRWQGADVPLAPDVLQVLGDGKFLNRTYQPDETAPSTLPVDLLIAYFPSQRGGQSIHSPQNCLPGAGWTFESSGTLTLTDSGGKQHRVGEYLVTNGNARLEVLYWYRSRGVDIASDYAAKWSLMMQSIRDGRTDGSLIRVTTSMLQGEAQSEARKRVVGFTASLDPLLSPFLPE